eukprot:1159626-Pelagomonas_calceolata.AAC.6
MGAHPSAFRRPASFHNSTAQNQRAQLYVGLFLTAVDQSTMLDQQAARALMDHAMLDYSTMPCQQAARATLYHAVLDYSTMLCQQAARALMDHAMLDHSEMLCQQAAHATSFAITKSACVSSPRQAAWHHQLLTNSKKLYMHVALVSITHCAPAVPNLGADHGTTPVACSCSSLRDSSHTLLLVIALADQSTTPVACSCSSLHDSSRALLLVIALQLIIVLRQLLSLPDHYVIPGACSHLSLLYS